jgi:SAF domain
VAAIVTVTVIIAGLPGSQARRRVVVAARPLPAFHLVGRTDLKIESLTNTAQDPTQLSQVLGTVTKESVPAGAPFPNGTITGPTSRTSLNGLVFIRFHATAVQLPGIVPGDNVVLGFAPVAPAIGARAGTISALLIDDSVPKTGIATYIVGIGRQEVEWFLRLVGRSRMLVFRG